MNSFATRARRTRRTCGEREPDATGEREPEREAGHEERELRELAARIGILEERLEELRQERDFLRTQVENLIMIHGMTAQKALPNPERRGLWARLFGR